jgi:hypothetical protein
LGLGVKVMGRGAGKARRRLGFPLGLSRAPAEGNTMFPLPLARICRGLKRKKINSENSK